MRRILIVLAMLLLPISLFAQSGVGGGGQSNVSGGGGGGPLTPTNFPATTPGVFTLAAQNDPFIFTTTGGGTCTPLTILNLGGSTIKLTDGLASCVNLPTSGVTNGFTDAFAAYMINPNANSAGQFGWTGAVGYYSQVWCRGGSAANTRCWGANFGASDDTALPATLFGNEYDLTVNNNTTTGAGTLYSFRGAGQPTANNFPTLRIQAPQSTGTFTSGLQCDDGSLAASATNPYGCVNVGQKAAGNSQDSQSIWFNAHAGATPLATGISLSQDNVSIWTNTLGMQLALDANNGGTGFVEAYGVTLKATAALAAGTLVKIDTANPNSVVVCTTADTICHGFVQGTAAGTCNTGLIHCGITTTPGSKAFGTLGTGTCAIGNNVIVDTTTNGRIKCTASVPAQGAWIGIALQAVSTVGNTVDILTKFQ